MRQRHLLSYVEFNQSRHGRDRYYFRFKGRKRIRLPDNYGSAEFIRAYSDALTTLERQREELSPYSLPAKPITSTLQHLLHAYQQHRDFLDLDSSTQQKRRSILSKMMLEPMSPTDGRLFGCMPLAKFDENAVELLRDRKKDVPFAADERLKILRQAMDVGIKLGLVTKNYAHAVRPFRKPSDGHRTMHVEEARQYLQHHGKESKAALALIIMMYLGIRVSDLALLGPQNRRKNFRGEDILEFTPYKGHKRHPITLTIPIHPILARYLDLYTGEKSTYLVKDFGKPFASAKSLGNRISDWMCQAGLPHLSAHSVRKGVATNIAENEATEHMLIGLFGWRDSRTAKIYTAKAQQSKLAGQGVSKIDWEQTESDLPHPGTGVGFHSPSPRKSSNKIK